MGHHGTYEGRAKLSPLPDRTEPNAVEEQRVLRDVDRKLRKKSLIRAIPELLLNVGTLYKMLRDGSFHLSWATRGLIIGGLAYFLLPTDATPDYLPVIGFIDDTVVIGMIVKRLATEIDRYKQHASNMHSVSNDLLDVSG